jgi:hypothetical protein
MIKRRQTRNLVMEKSNCWHKVLSVDIRLPGLCIGP